MTIRELAFWDANPEIVKIETYPGGNRERFTYADVRNVVPVMGGADIP